MTKQKTLINNLSEGPVLGGLIRFAIPLMLANLLQAFYSMVDMIVVGQFSGPVGLSAVGIGGQIANLFLAVGWGFSSGGQVVISQQVGAGSKKISRTIGTLLTLEMILAVISTLVGIVFYKPILSAMNTSEAAWSEAVNYHIICCCGMVFIYGYNALCAVLRGMGESKLPMVFVAISSLVNVVLDLLFVGVFHWGAGGAAAATVISQGIAFLSAAVYLYRHKEAAQFDFRLKSFAIDPQQLKALCRLGIPSVVQQFMITGSITFINAQVNAFGLVASAVDSVGGKLNTVVNIVTGAISAASATMIAQSFGARKLERVKKAYRACLIVCMVWFCILTACYLTLPRQIFGAFTSDPEVLDMAPLYLKYAVVWLLALCSMDAPYSLVQGVGFASFNLVVGLLDGVVARIGLSLLLGHFMGLPGFWLGNGLAGFVTTIPMTIYYLSGKWKNRQLVTE